jgi:hypothetical protein
MLQEIAIMATRSEYLADLIRQSKQSGNPTITAEALAKEIESKRSRECSELEVCFVHFHHFDQLVPDILERFRETIGVCRVLEASSDPAAQAAAKLIREDYAALVDFLYEMDELSIGRWGTEGKTYDDDEDEDEEEASVGLAA